jgi:hypothetical protein
MHSRQASLFEQAVAVADRTAAKKKQQQQGASPTSPIVPGVLWKYTDEEDNVFYLEQKVTGTVVSPTTGKRFTPKLRQTLEKVTQVKKEMKEDLGK